MEEGMNRREKDERVQRKKQIKAEKKNRDLTAM